MLFFHPEASWRRAAIHTPHGVLLALAGLYLAPVVCLVGAVLFIAYELNEDRHTADQAWKDELGALIGFFGVIVVALIRNFL